jgi:hypothetical protein
MTDTTSTMVEAVGRARHSLQQMHGPGTASVTVHGVCPDAGCHEMNVIEVRADTTSCTCAGCGSTFAA